MINMKKEAIIVLIIGIVIGLFIGVLISRPQKEPNILAKTFQLPEKSENISRSYNNLYGKPEDCISELYNRYGILESEVINCSISWVHGWTLNGKTVGLRVSCACQYGY